MPSHTNPSALVGLHLANGAPWEYPRWKEITGVQHGLFPSDDGLLPSGWTRSTSDSVSSYFSLYANVVGEDARQKFAASNTSGGVIPGRTLWRSWVTSNWARWGIHSRITDVLIAANIHPITLYSNNPDIARNKTISSTYLPMVLDDIALALFGDEAFEGGDLLPFTPRNLLQQIAQRTWSHLTRQMSRSRLKLASLEAAATVAFEDLDRDKLTKAKILAVIRAVHRWKALAELYGDPAKTDLIAQMESELAGLIEGLGALVKARPTKSVRIPAAKKKLCNVQQSSLHQLAKKEDVDELIHAYIEFFYDNGVAEDESIINPHPQLKVNFAERGRNGVDPGVEVEISMTPDELAKSLGFSHSHIPLLFNEYRHTGGLDAWNPQSAHLFRESDPSLRSPQLKPLRLHWHQLAGVHAIVRKMFSEEEDPGRCPGILLADEVGLGKTYQAGTVIAFLADLVLRQQQKLPLPPIIGKYLPYHQCPYLGKQKIIPNLPHLIVAPGTLLGQWESELRVLFKPGSVDIFVYGTGGKEAQASFWDPSSPYSQSIHGCNRIIVASHSAILNDFSKLHRTKKGTSSRGKLPWAARARIGSYDTMAKKTLYGQQFLSVTLDESHEFRNNTKHVAALTLVERALVRLIATATPLQTSNQDSAAMGRLCGIPFFLSEACYAEEKVDQANLRRAKKELAELKADEGVELELTDEEGEGDGKEKERAAKEARENPLKLCQIAISRRHQKHFDNRIIRRTITSKNYLGEPVLPLPDCVVVLCVVELSDREKEIITILSDQVVDDVSLANGSRKISSRCFYIEYRTGVGYATVGDGPIPHFNNLLEWEAAKSTKMDLVARIVHHTLSSDLAPPVRCVDGVPVFPEIPASQPGIRPTSKVAVYQEFPSLGRVLRNVFDLYGIRFVYIDGQTSYEKRTRIVNQFNTDPEIRVIIFSSVGSVGLNLSRASVIIFLDQPWSAQDERQIRGRVHRQPQSRTVYSYHILAKDTADIILSSQARGKRDMMEAFLSKQRGKELFDLFSGKTVIREAADDEEDEEVDEDGEKAKKSKPKVSRKSKKTDTNAVKVADGLQESSTQADRELNETASDGPLLPSMDDTDYTTDISMRSQSAMSLSTGNERSPSPEEEPMPPPARRKGHAFISESPVDSQNGNRIAQGFEPLFPESPTPLRRTQSSPPPGSAALESLFTPIEKKRKAADSPSPPPRHSPPSSRLPGPSNKAKLDARPLDQAGGTRSRNPFSSEVVKRPRIVQAGAGQPQSNARAGTGGSISSAPRPSVTSRPAEQVSAQLAAQPPRPLLPSKPRALTPSQHPARPTQASAQEHARASTSSHQPVRPAMPPASSQPQASASSQKIGSRTHPPAPSQPRASMASARSHAGGHGAPAAAAPARFGLTSTRPSDQHGSPPPSGGPFRKPSNGKRVLKGREGGSQ